MKPVGRSHLRTTRTQRRHSVQALIAALTLAVTAASCAEESSPQVLIELADSQPGDDVGVIARETPDGRFVEWVHRINGTIHRVDIDANASETSSISESVISTIEVGTAEADKGRDASDQRGLVGHTMIGDRRFVAFTEPDPFALVVAEVLADGALRPVWNAGPTSAGALGGVLRERDGQLLLGLGRNTAWDRETGVGGAILELDPDGNPDQPEGVVSVGYTNPWAFAVTGDRAIWVADNAAGPDPDNPATDDVERVGRADVTEDRNEMTEVPWTGRAPSAMVELPDGRLGICGFLDNELRAYEVVADDALERAGTIMPCLTGAAVFDDGTIATIAQTEDGMAILVLRS